MRVLGPPFPPVTQPGVGRRRAAFLIKKHHPLPSSFQLGERQSSQHSLPPACAGLSTDTGQNWQQNIAQTRISKKAPKSSFSSTELQSPLVACWHQGNLTSLWKRPKVESASSICNAVKPTDTRSHVCCIEIGKDRHTQEIFGYRCNCFRPGGWAF